MKKKLLLHNIFERTAKKFPQNISIEIPSQKNGKENIKYTYKEIDEKANAAAREISSYVKKDSIIAIMLPRDSHLVYLAELAVLKAGAAYTSIDTQIPMERIKFILKDSNAKLIITNNKYRNLFDEKTFDIEEFDVSGKTESSFTPPKWLNENCLSYVIYTSGTTGNPKGVMIEHKSVVNLVVSDVEYFKLNDLDRCAQNSSASYDSSVEEIWLAFSVGATLVVANDEVVRLGPDLGAWLRKEKISVFCPPPTLIKMGVCDNPKETLPSLKLIYFGGEPLSKEIVDLWAPGRHLENGYGPTECTVTCTRTRLYKDQKVTIGKPIINTFALSLNKDLEEVSPGERGELCIGGICLARGYLNREDLTKEKFISHPKFGRIYRTGDIVKIDKNGEIEYIERIDSQVKIRGHRVELGEIESEISIIKGVKSAACRLQKINNRDILIGYVVPEKNFKTDFLYIKNELHKKLPKHMVPSCFEKLEKLPTSSLSGKLDRKALPDFKGEFKEEKKILLKPYGDIENLVLKAAEETLCLNFISMSDDFFKLGADSLSAAVFISKLRQNEKTSSLTVRDVYENRTLIGMANIIKKQGKLKGVRNKEKSENKFSKWSLITTFFQILFITGEIFIGSIITFFLFFTVLPFLLDSLGGLKVAILSPVIGFLFFSLYFFFTLIFTVFLKKILIGKYKSGKHPALGYMYFKNWIVCHVLKLVPIGAFDCTEFNNIILRLLGAKIGKNVFIHRGASIFNGGWDLIEIGDNAVIGRDASVRPLNYENGELIFNNVKIGKNSKLGTRASLCPGSTIEEGGVLTQLSMLSPKNVIKKSEVFEGIPAHFKEKVKTHPKAFDPSYSSLKHAFILVLSKASIRGLIILIPLILFIVPMSFFDIKSSVIFNMLFLDSLGSFFIVTLFFISIFFQTYTLFAKAFIVRLMGKIKPGNYSIFGKTFIKILLKDSMVESCGTLLSGTLFWPYWLRLAGMKVGKNCEISTIIDVVPELITISDEVFFADGIYLGGGELSPGVVSIDEVYLGENTFVGNHAIIPSGSKLPKDILIGICTVADKEKIVEGSSWFGHPSFNLPKREVVEMDKSLTHNPSWYRFVTRFFWEGARFFLAPSSVILGLVCLKIVYYFYNTESFLLFWFLFLPLSWFSFMLFRALLVIVMKWILLGKVKQGIHPLWSCWCSRWDFLYVAWGRWAKSFITLFEGTLCMSFWLRLMGAKIGKKVLLGSGFSQVVDPDMLEFEDHSTVLCQFQAHSFEDRVLKIAPVKIKKKSTVGHSAVLLYGADIGENAFVLDNSVVMKQEKLLPGHYYAGCPTRPIDL